MSKYFEEFPEIQYGTMIAKNLIARPSVMLPEFNTPTAFYDYEITNDLRPDQVAGLYYDDPTLVWLIFLVNNIVDPYHDWPMTDRQLEEYLVIKYGVDDPIIGYKHKTTGAVISKETYELNGTFGKIVAGQYVVMYGKQGARDTNDKKRVIKLLDKRFASKAKSELKRVMNV
jgi:hypothetical protein